MMSLFHPPDCEALRRRFAELQPDSPRRWGRMDPAQMLAHCAASLDGVLAARVLHRPLRWRLLGPLMRPLALGPRPFPRGTAAPQEIVVADSREFETELRRLAHLLDRCVQRGADGMPREPHPFLGRLTGRQWGRLMYKHLDHHLRQFGV